MFTTKYTQKALVVCPLLWIPVAPKPRPMYYQTAMYYPMCYQTRSNGTLPVSSNQRASKHDVIMARQKPPASSHYGPCPFKFINSYNSVNTNSIKVHSGLNDGKICPLYDNTSAPSLHRELTKSHPLHDLSCGVRGVRPCHTVPSLTLLY